MKTLVAIVLVALTFQACLAPTMAYQTSANDVSMIGTVLVTVSSYPVDVSAWRRRRRRTSRWRRRLGYGK